MKEETLARQSLCLVNVDCIASLRGRKKTIPLFFLVRIFSTSVTLDCLEQIRMLRRVHPSVRPYLMNLVSRRNLNRIRKGWKREREAKKKDFATMVKVPREENVPPFSLLLLFHSRFSMEPKSPDPVGVDDVSFCAQIAGAGCCGGVLS